MHIERAVYLTLLILLLLIYCGPKQQEVERYMEDGVEVVVNHLEPYKIKGEPSSLHLAEEFRIDFEEEDLVEKGLSDVQTFDIDTEGNIYFSHQRAPEKFIFKFDKNGNFTTSFCKKGQGPGECQYPGAFSINKKNEIHIIDQNRNKLLVFDNEGGLLQEISVDLGILALIPLDNRKYFLFKHHPDYTTELLHLIAFLCSSKFEEIKEIERISVPFPMKANKINALGFGIVLSVSSGKIFMGTGEKGYEIRVYDLDGNLFRKIRKEYKPVKVTDEYKKIYFRRFNQPGGDAAKKKYYFPEHMFPFQWCFSDDEGRLFVMTCEESNIPGEYMYDVFNLEGVFIGRISLGNWGINTSGLPSPLMVKAKKDRIFCLKQKESGYKELVVYKMKWE